MTSLIIVGRTRAAPARGGRHEEQIELGGRPGRTGQAMVDYRRTFLSYAHEDADLARTLAVDLQNRGVQIWFDVMNGSYRAISTSPRF